MNKHSLIKDEQTRKAVDRLEERINRIEEIPQLSATATTADIVKVINQITNSVKRRRQ